MGIVLLTEDSAELAADGRTETARTRGEPEPGDAVLWIRVELADVDDPRVWRQLLVPAAIHLDRFHSVIQDAMGWQNCHMHAFTIDGDEYGRPDGELDFRDERTATLAALREPGAHFVYTYDFRGLLGAPHHRGTGPASLSRPSLTTLPGRYRGVPARELRRLPRLQRSQSDPRRPRA